MFCWNFTSFFLVSLSLLSFTLMLNHARFDVFKQLIVDQSAWPHFGDYHPLQQLFLHLCTIVWAPMIHLYVFGPPIPVVGGFWQGKTLTEICYLLTGDLEYHSLNPNRCYQILFNGFESMYTVVHISLCVAYCLLLYNVLYTKWVINHAIGKLTEQQVKIFDGGGLKQ